MGVDVDLPQLQSIILDDSALEGDWQKNRKGIEFKPYNYKNTLTMKSSHKRIGSYPDLPSLTEFRGQDHHFLCFGSVVLKSTSEWSF